MQRKPTPPLFHQGPSPQARVTLFSLLALVLLFIDSRWQVLDIARTAISTIIYPIQQVLLIPRDQLHEFETYLQAKSQAKDKLDSLEQKKIEMAQLTTRAALLEKENAQLRALINLKAETSIPSTLVEILYESRDPFHHRLIVNKGSLQGIEAGMPVIDDKGVVGQIVRTSLLSSELALLTDQAQNIPVQVLRNGLRAIAFGGESTNHLILKYLSIDVDITKGDILVTSGLDGIYPPGLPVAKVTSINNNATTGFARIIATPISGFDRYRHYLVLKTPIPSLPDLPIAEDIKARQGNLIGRER